MRIFGDEFPVRAQVAVINGLSAHAGQDLLIEYARATRERVRQIFLVHGEPLAGFVKDRDDLGPPAADCVLRETRCLRAAPRGAQTPGFLTRGAAALPSNRLAKSSSVSVGAHTCPDRTPHPVRAARPGGPPGRDGLQSTAGAVQVGAGCVAPTMLHREARR